MMAKEGSNFTITTCFLFVFIFSCSSSTTEHDMINPPTVFPTNPTTTPPVTFPPVTITPTNPTTSPVTIPSTVPVTVPPVTGTAPPVVTNPATTYPTPTTNVPVVAPPVVTNAPPNVPAVAPPIVTNAPATPGQSWCVARPGTSQIMLQEALDYACGIGGADCTQIQQGGNCYIPNTLQNHASVAFNSYYQKNPSPQSCDFGGAAAVVNTNPSSGSCIYQLFSSASPSTPTPSTQIVTQPTTPTTITPPTGGGIIGSATPPPIFNPANPMSNTPTNPASGTTAVYGFDGSPTGTTSAPSESTGSRICFDQVLVVTFLLAGILVLRE